MIVTLQLFRTVIHSCLHCGVKCSGEADIKGRNSNLIFSIPTALDGGAHILHLTSRSFLPLSSVFPIYKGCHSLPLPRSLPELMTYISCRSPHEQGQQRRTTPKGSVCVLIGALSSWSFFILPWWLELSLCLPHRRNIWNTSCPRTISFHLRMRWFVSYRGGVCSRVLNGVVGSVVNGKEWKRGRDLMKN